MQAVISLCHFCETHGPRVLMTCQPMRSMPLDLPETCSPIGEIKIQELSDSPEHPAFYGDCRNTVFDLDDRCSACTSFGNGPCLLSNDHANKTSYVSSQVALSEPVFDKVKYACLRSLSCEVTSSPIILISPQKSSNEFNSHGYLKTLPSTSKTQEEIDEELRVACESGGHVLFSDAEHGCTLSLTFRLQDSKARGFLRLFSLIVVTNDVTFLLNNHDFFLAAINTMKDKLQSLSSIVFADEMAEENASLRPENASRIGKLPMGLFREKRKINLDTQRPLQVITGDVDVWNKLHRQMMWTLRTQTLRTGESILEGMPTQDMLVIMEMDETDIVELDLDSPNSQALTLMQLENLKIIARTMVESGCDEDLELLIKQVVRGGQVVVESASRPLAKQFLLAICNLLPIGCIKILNWSEHYQHSYMYNLLGCPLGVDIPLEAEVLLVRLNANGQEGPSLEDCTFEIRKRPHVLQCSERPTLVGRFKQLLLDAEVQDSVLEATIKSTREQWMAKSKLIYQLGKQSSKVDLQRAIRVVKASEADREVLLFWQACLSKVYKAHVIKTINGYTEKKQ